MMSKPGFTVTGPSSKHRPGKLGVVKGSANRLGHQPQRRMENRMLQ